jgi:transcriptional antiterminator/mannitol/fructose-specific phosphotransferase system IIA component (Ntr-type)
MKQDQPMKLDEIAALFNISPRSARYDLDRIDAYLAESGFPKLVRKTNQGISIKLDPDIAEKLLENIDSIDTYEYVLSQNERMVYMLYVLLEQKGYTTVNELAEQMMVSKNTIQNDLKEIKQCLGERSILLETSKGRGIQVIGDELELRKAASKLLFEHFDTLNMVNVNFIKLFKDIDIPYIQNVIRIAEEQMENTFADYAFNNLLIHLAIAIRRIQLNKDIVMDYNELRNLSKTPEFAIASGMARMLETKYRIQIPDSEIGYIAIHLLGSNFTLNEGKDKEDYLYIQMLVSTLIEKVTKSYQHDFCDDEQLFENLMQHMRPALYRFRHRININNPLLKEIKSSYQKMFSCVQNECATLMKDDKIKIGDEEIGYITIHFMTSIERMKEHQNRKPNVLVVCATGIGTSKFVSVKLKSIFDIDIVDTISTHDVQKAIAEHVVDLIVTTIPLKVDGIKIIMVEPFLNEKNISELSLFFSQYVDCADVQQVVQAKPQVDKVIAEGLLHIIRENCTIQNMDKLKDEISTLLNLDKQNKPSLADLLQPSLVRIDVEAKGWEEAVVKGGQLLLDNGYITSSYIQAMTDNVKQLGAYIVLLPGIAMPHAKPEDGVLKTGVSILVLKKNISFGNDADAKVSVVITMAAVDRINHTDALKELVGILEKYDFLKKIKLAKTPEAILQLFSETY